jgi:hypothetical protein
VKTPEARSISQEQTVSLTQPIVDNSAGAYPTEGWQATYFSVSGQGSLTAHRVTVHVPQGLSSVCPPVRIGRPGCVYGVRRWGFLLRPSALEAAGFDPLPLLPAGDDAGAVQAVLRACAFDLPGEFIIASPEHPFRLLAPDGTLRGSCLDWRTYLGALSYYVSGGKVDVSFLHFWAEAEESYQLAVDQCLAALREDSAPEEAGNLASFLANRN